VDELTVMIFWHEGQEIPGPQRVAWLRALLPDTTVLENTDRHPVDFADPAIWDLWTRSIRARYPHTPDLVFASEDYGHELARRLGARFVCVDRDRRVVPVSATEIRARPWAVWRHIPAIVRPAFVQRIAIVGGESTGKTTLAHALAEQFSSVCVPEYAREFLAANGNRCTPADMPAIAAEQARREDLAAARADRFLFCDTNAIVTKMWSHHYFGSCDAAVESLARRPYALTLVTAPDLPWVDDGLRDTPTGREWFFDTAVDELTRQGAPYRVVRGTGESRTRCAARHIEAFFTLPGVV
jgi:NadR type nicotinamide-nucleotide adenylyltransferase